jgi:hypothetical protein
LRDNEIEAIVLNILFCVSSTQARIAKTTERPEKCLRIQIKRCSVLLFSDSSSFLLSLNWVIGQAGP